MTRLIQRFLLLAGIAVVATALAGQAYAMGVDEPAKPAASHADKQDEKKDAKPAADSSRKYSGPGPV
jgi:hypothetical protein